MNNYIRNILGTRGWQDIEKMFRQTLEECRDMEGISGNFSDEIVARETRAKVMTYKRVNDLLNSILRNRAEESQDKKSYK